MTEEKARELGNMLATIKATRIILSECPDGYVSNEELSEMLDGFVPLLKEMLFAIAPYEFIRKI